MTANTRSASTNTIPTANPACPEGPPNASCCSGATVVVVVVNVTVVVVDVAVVVVDDAVVVVVVVVVVEDTVVVDVVVNLLSLSFQVFATASQYSSSDNVGRYILSISGRLM